jgi:hypothetical protein
MRSNDEHSLRKLQRKIFQYILSDRNQSNKRKITVKKFKLYEKNEENMFYVLYYFQDFFFAILCFDG